jgi:hypothetical protein
MAYRLRMPTYWQPVEVPERCFLQEALLWLAFQRLPVAFYNDENKEIRSASEYDGPAIETPSGTLTDEECKRAGIPPDPHFHYLVDESPSRLQTYNDLEAQFGHDEARRRIKEAMDKEQADHERAYMEWQPRYDRATEYAASQIFVALRDGRLRASGRLLPSLNVDEAIARLKAEERYVGDLPLTDIPRAFWSLKDILFDISAAHNSDAYYCHVVLRTHDLLAAFPGERQQIGAEQIGDTIVLNETAQSTSQPTSRGRPSILGSASIWKFPPCFRQMNFLQRKKQRYSTFRAGLNVNSAFGRAAPRSGRS